MMRGPMMRTLLEDRFQLKTHRETRDVAVYMMMVAKGGAKLRASTAESCTPLDPTNLAALPKPVAGKPWCVITPPVRSGPMMVWDVRGISLEVFCQLLHPDGRHVIDKTGLTGTFDIHLEWSAGNPATGRSEGGAASEPEGRSLIGAIREQLGLQFSPGRGPQEFLIIDRVEKPSEN